MIYEIKQKHNGLVLEEKGDEIFVCLSDYSELIQLSIGLTKAEAQKAVDVLLKFINEKVSE